MTSGTSPAPAPRSDVLEELRRLGTNASASGHTFLVAIDGASFTVDVDVDSDTDAITAFELHAGYDALARRAVAPTEGALYRDAPPALEAIRPLSITLRRENAADTFHKEQGDAVEWQSGDSAFDDEVYVDSPTTDPRVLEAVLNATSRAAVRALLAAGFTSVSIDDERGRVSARLPRSAFDYTGQGRGADVARTFANLLSTLPIVRRREGKHPSAPLSRLTLALTVIGGFGWLTNVGFLGALTAVSSGLRSLRDGGAHRPISAPTELVLASLVVALGAGISGAILYGNFVTRRVRGRSNTPTLITRAKLAGFAGFSVLVFAVLVVMATFFFGSEH